MTASIVAFIGAAGSVVSVWLTVRLEKVKRAVNGTTTDLLDRLHKLEGELAESKSQAVAEPRPPIFKP